jgi:hypothetical protein
MGKAKAYRPIALLETFSKLLEKMVATRVHHDIGAFNLVPHIQFGGRLRSGCNDAGLVLAHDVTAAKKDGKYLAALAFDIKGFFDNINHARMAHVLHIMGFAPQMVGWISSFFANCKVSFRLGSFRLEDLSIGDVGTPQGSPLSPALATIYTAPCITDWSLHPTAGVQYYVDDGVIKVTHKRIDVALGVAAKGLVFIEASLHQAYSLIAGQSWS